MLSEAMMTEFFSPGKYVWLKYRDETNENRVYKMVVGYQTETNIVLRFSAHEIFNMVPLQTTVGLTCFNTKNNINYFFSATVLATSSDKPQTVTISIPSEIKPPSLSTKRRYFRCDVNLSFIYRIPKYPDQYGRVIDLSANGLFAVVPYQPFLKKDVLLDCVLFLPNVTDPLNFISKIIRVKLTESPAELGIALNFDNISENPQNEITKYLFQRQRELIQTGRIKSGKKS